MKKYSTPEVIFDKFTTEEIAIIRSSIEHNDTYDDGASIGFESLS